MSSASTELRDEEIKR
jgi:hypothetical protein